MKIIDYIVSNWNDLPKSQFNKDEVVIFSCTDDSNEGWGHHYYNGYGVDVEGKLVMCYSSGCSCNGSCGADHVTDFKTLTIKDNTLFEDINPERINFDELSVNFSDY
jgi:hypothetical protein